MDNDWLDAFLSTVFFFIAFGGAAFLMMFLG